VLILPTTVRSAPTDVATGSTPTRSVSPKRGVMNKDGASVKSDNAPVLNK